MYSGLVSTVPPPLPSSLRPLPALLRHMITQLLARSLRPVAGGRSCISVRGGCWETRLRPRREPERFSGGWRWCATEARVVTWKTSRTLFSEYLAVHSAYATAPICRARLVPFRTQQRHRSHGTDTGEARGVRGTF